MSPLWPNLMVDPPPSHDIRIGGLSNYYNNMYKTQNMCKTTRYYVQEDVRKVSTLNYSLMVDNVFEYNAYIYNFILVERNDFHFDQYLMVDSILSRERCYIAIICRLKNYVIFKFVLWDEMQGLFFLYVLIQNYSKNLINEFMENFKWYQDWVRV